MRVCYYGEMDAFVGSISQNSADLDRLIWDLKLLSLLYDVVITPPDAFIEHGLMLSAMEVLAPFVHDGRITTSTAPNSKAPLQYFQQQWIKNWEERNGNARDKEKIKQFEARWETLLPDKWILTRNVPNQIADSLSFVENQLNNLSNQYKGIALYQNLIERQKDTGNLPSRRILMACAAKLRDSMPIGDLRRILLAIQASYFKMGESKQYALNPNEAVKCTIYPGSFSRKLHATYTSSSLLPYLPTYDWNNTPLQIISRAKQWGIDLSLILNWDSHSLLTLANTQEWQYLRPYLLDDAVIETERVSAIRNTLIKSQDIREKIHAVSSYLPNTSIVQPTSFGNDTYWLYSVMAVLGKQSFQQQSRDHLSLDWQNREFFSSGKKICIQLSRQHAYLLTILILVDEAGIHIRALKRLKQELDQIKHPDSTIKVADEKSATSAQINADEHHLSPSPNMFSDFDNALRNQLDVEKSRLNTLIKPFGIKVIMKNGRWFLKKETSILLVNTPLSLSQKTDSSCVNNHFSGQLMEIYELLYEYFPGGISLNRLCDSLNKTNDEVGRKAVSRSIYRLKNKLREQKMPWAIYSDFRGYYRLIPLT